MLAFDLWETGMYNNRGLADEGIVQDIMGGTVGKDGMRVLVMALAAAHGLVSEDGKGVNSEHLAAMMANYTPMLATGLPRNEDSPAASWSPTKEDLKEFWQSMFEDMGLD